MTFFEQAEKEKKEAKLREQSKIQTKVIETFHDVDRSLGQPTRTGIALTDVSVRVLSGLLGNTFNDRGQSPIFFADLKQTPTRTEFKQTAFGWKGYAVILSGNKGNEYIVFRETCDRDAFYEALITAITGWKRKFPEIK